MRFPFALVIRPLSFFIFSFVEYEDTYPSIIDVWFVCLLVFCSLSDHLVFAYHRTQISVVLALIDRFCPNDFISKVSYLCTLLCTLKLCHTIYLLELRQASDDSFV